MLSYYLKLSAKVALWHFIAQLVCVCIGIPVFGLLLGFRAVQIFVSLFLTGGYIVYMYAKLYKVGERDTKSYVHEKPYTCKGAVLYIPVFALSIAFALLYSAAFSVSGELPALFMRLPFWLWSFSFQAFMLAADGSISMLFWVLYFGVPLCVTAFGYYAGMRRMEIGYQFFSNLVYKKKS